jgi:hypothetical protein
MKVAIFSESPEDDVALHLLAAAVLARPLDVVATNRRRAGGFGAVLSTAAVELRAAQHNTEAEGLIIAVDADDTPPHLAEHELPRGSIADCRACQLLEMIRRERHHLRPRPGGRKINCAVALAVPAIEAWYRCGVDVHATEARFLRDFKAGQRFHEVRRQLKREAYGSDRAPRAVVRATAEREGLRLAADIATLEQRFPSGFGLFARMLRAWPM